MPETLEIPALLPALPEIVLVVGAMALLMVGAFRGEESSRSIDVAAILLLILTGAVIVLLPAQLSAPPAADVTVIVPPLTLMFPFALKVPPLMLTRPVGLTIV